MWGGRLGWTCGLLEKIVLGDGGAMEIGEKIKELRKQMDWTQEELAEKLFVSRTAVSKWESGKGTPNIDSLKDISTLFSVSIDELLSSEELISIAKRDNKINLRQLVGVIFGVLDLGMFSFIFLPLYGQPEGDFIRAVNLFVYSDVMDYAKTIFFCCFIILSIFGLFELFVQKTRNEVWMRRNNFVSISFQAGSLLIFIATQQPYVAAFVFMFLMIKVALVVRAASI
jgi:transcriptional regulator with XRE-family HTH domain